MLIRLNINDVINNFYFIETVISQSYNFFCKSKEWGFLQSYNNVNE